MPLTSRKMGISQKPEPIHLGPVPLLLLALTAAHAQSDSPAVRQGPGDLRVGYERADYQTDSTSLAARSGQPADLLTVLTSPPLGLPPVPIPADNPPTYPKVQLGRKLFFDRRLSANNTVSCAMCHVAEQGFAQNELKNPVGIEGKAVRRNAPTIYNTAYLKRLFHDGREISLENQVWSPLLAENEMGNLSIGTVLERIANLADYAGLFERAFGRAPNVLSVGMALASYQRTLVSGDSPFDRWYFTADAGAIDASAQRGFALFVGKARCSVCHTIGEESALFTDQGFHNTGVGYYATMRSADVALDVFLAPGHSERIDTRHFGRTGLESFRDLGRYEVTQQPADRWRYRTPSLRNVALTAPYMHDGSLPSLRDVLAFYNRGGVPNESLDPLIRPLGLSDTEIDDLRSFLLTLTGSNVDTLVSDAFAAPIGGG